MDTAELANLVDQVRATPLSWPGCRVRSLSFFAMWCRYHVSIFNYPPGDAESERRADMDAIRGART